MVNSFWDAAVCPVCWKQYVLVTEMGRVKSPSQPEKHFSLPSSDVLQLQSHFWHLRGIPWYSLGHQGKMCWNCGAKCFQAPAGHLVYLQEAPWNSACGCYHTRACCWMGRELCLCASAVEALQMVSLCWVSAGQSKDGIYSCDDTVIPPCVGLPPCASGCCADSLDCFCSFGPCVPQATLVPPRGSCLLGGHIVLF